jgi:hypothetical protein
MTDKQCQPGDLRQHPGTKAVAIKTAPNVTAGDWFVLDPVNGGHYVTTAEVNDWPDLKLAIQEGETMITQSDATKEGL